MKNFYIRKVGKYINVPVIVTDLLPKQFGALTCVFFVLIRPKFRDDEGLIQHELTHVKQNLRTFFYSALRQYWDKQHRLNRESEAYAVQLKHSPDFVWGEGRNIDFYKDLYIDFMYNKYNLGMTKKKIRANYNQWIKHLK